MICPHCHEQSFAKKKNIMDGWTVKATVEVCALCGKEIKPAAADTKETSKADARLAGLSALLGGESLQKVTLAGKADRDFCRNCQNFIAHPFKNICALTDTETDPQNSCASFTERQKTDK